MTRVNPDDLETPAGDPEPDPELARLLQEWAVPAVPDSLDQRVTALYRSRIPRRPLWQRLLTAQIRVPLPVAVALIAALLVAVWMHRKPNVPVESVESGESSRAASLETPATVPPGPRTSSLAGFEPVREMNVTVLPQGGTP